jgi:D-3-phosphoglycerate dehydrogenase intervening domain
MCLPVPCMQGELAATAVNAPMVSAEVLAELQPFVALAQGLGRTAVQLVGDAGLTEVSVTYFSPRGDDLDTRLLRAMVIKVRACGQTVSRARAREAHGERERWSPVCIRMSATCATATKQGWWCRGEAGGGHEPGMWPACKRPPTRAPAALLSRRSGRARRCLPCRLTATDCAVLAQGILEQHHCLSCRLTATYCAVLVQGILEQITTAQVNLVNADLLAKNRGLRIKESTVFTEGRYGRPTPRACPSVPADAPTSRRLRACAGVTGFSRASMSVNACVRWLISPRRALLQRVDRAPV